MTSVFDLKEGFRWGMHGCGYYAGINNANALEGLKFWKTKGVFFFEVDVSRTTDGKYVALSHQMNPLDLQRLEVYDYGDKDAFSHDWFMRQKLCRYSTKGLSPMNIPVILQEMLLCDDLIVMFDLSGLWMENETEHFTSSLVELMYKLPHNKNVINRVMIEAYNQGMVDGIRNVSEEIPIVYCVHGSRKNGIYQYLTLSELKKQNITIVSYPWHFTYQYPGEIEKFKDNETVLLSYFSTIKDVKNKYKGVNIALVDYVFIKNRLFKYPFYIFERIKNKIIHKVISTYVYRY